ncbi:MAG: heparan-alpha-glucosaminide N-acetyltransferase domain-containing protein [Planctomycetota bacterium]
MSRDGGAGERLPALDVMRGLVMALMAVDHVDAVVNGRHSQNDAALLAGEGPLSTPDFLTRWCSHLCAPTFVFLAGMSIALSSRKYAGSATGQRYFEGHLVLRGLSLLAIELVLVSSMFHTHFSDGDGGGWTWRPFYLQVIFAIGASILAMAVLRRLPLLLQSSLVVGLMVVCELVAVSSLDGGPSSLWSVLLFHLWAWPGWEDPVVFVLYPILPWLAVMLLGHVVGQIAATRGIAPRSWALAGVASLLVFAALRAIDRFGNMGLHRRDGSWLEWLHCSKYPPSLTFLSMELGLMALCIAAMMAWSRACVGGPGAVWRALVTLGRVPMFFYLLHLLLIGGIALSGLVPGHRGTWLVSWALAAVVVVVSLPLCAAYARYKRDRGGWTRFL